ncbi:hypothetical protein BDZ91DRAFT_255585 [Kalaharituber pfeilii]|nr:hypothetical protein BDZ91DRAFT_255585 [Kalaharituber pfeilii]
MHGYMECRPFHFPGKPGCTIGVRIATMKDLDALARLAQVASTQLEGGGSYGVRQFCWGRNEDPTTIYRQEMEMAINDSGKQAVYVLEDTSEHELLAAAIVMFKHDEQVMPVYDRFAMPARWLHYQTEVYNMRKSVEAHKQVHLKELFIDPELSYIETWDPKNPDPFLAKALFHFIYTLPEEVKNADNITALVPILTAGWLYGRLGFETLDNQENRRRIQPPDELQMHQGYATGFVDLELMVWRRRP